MQTPVFLSSIDIGDSGCRYIGSHRTLPSSLMSGTLLNSSRYPFSVHEITADCCLSAFLIVPAEGWVEECACVSLWTCSIFDEGGAKVRVIIHTAVPEPTFALILHIPA